MGAPYGYYHASNGHVAIDREKANVLRCSSWAQTIFRLRPAFFEAQNCCQAECPGLTVLYRIDT